MFNSCRARIVKLDLTFDDNQKRIEFMNNILAGSKLKFEAA